MENSRRRSGNDELFAESLLSPARQTMMKKEEQNLISMLKRKMSHYRNLCLATLMMTTFLTFFLYLGSNSVQHPSFHCCDQDRTVEYEQGSYGGGHKVIAFTYFKPIISASEISRKYVEGIRGNLQAIHQIYGPEWTMRLYHNLAEGDPVLEELRPLSSKQFVLCDINHNPLLANASILLPTLWRFLPLLDDQVQVALFRDLDSRPTQREMDAVKEWQASKHILHVMRDHPAHDMPILAGMWGMKLGAKPGVREALRAIFLDIFRKSSTYYSYDEPVGSQDQSILETYIWPVFRSLALVHDSYHCQRFGKSRPWPSQRLKGANNYVGAPVALNSTLNETCPEKCRPREHGEWRYC